MNFESILSASKRFLRTREAVHMLPSLRGFIRHIEATYCASSLISKWSVC
jgi:hypothetical protein